MGVLSQILTDEFEKVIESLSSQLHFQNNLSGKGKDGHYIFQIEIRYIPLKRP